MKAWIDRHLEEENRAAIEANQVYIEELPGDCARTSYSLGIVELSKQHAGYIPPDLTPWSLEIATEDIRAPWTLAMLQKLHADLGHLLNDTHVLAAFGEATDDMISILA